MRTMMGNKKHTDYSLILTSISAVSAGLFIAWGLYILPVEYPFRPLFLFVTAPAVLLVFVNIHAIPKENPSDFWMCVSNMLILLIGANVPIFVENFFEMSGAGGNYLTEALYEAVSKVFHYGLTTAGACGAVFINIGLIRRNSKLAEKQKIQQGNNTSVSKHK